MEMINELVAIGFNGFSPRYIPALLFQLSCAGLFAWVIGRLFRYKFGYRPGYVLLKAIAIALLVSIVKYSLPFSILAASVLLIFGLNTQRDKNAKVCDLLILVCAVGCGTGSIIQTFIGFVLLTVVLLILPVNERTR